MILYRIASTQFIDDLSAEGAFLHGGRWNQKGQRVLYTSPSISLAAWEVFVHLPKEIDLSTLTYSRISIEIPNSLVYTTVAPVNGYIHSLEAYEKEPHLCWEITDEWLNNSNQIYMEVPSFSVKDECNYLLNPLHPLFHQVKIIEKVSYEFDRRAFGKNIKA